MRKIFCLISAFLLVSLFVGCETPAKNTSGSLETTKNEQNGEGSSSAYVSSPTFESISAYNEYVEEQTSAGNVPECFLGYEKLSFLGNFKKAMLPPGFDQYYYSFNNNGTEFKLTVYHALSNYMKENPRDLTKDVFPETVQPQNTNDMRVFGEGEDVSKWHFYIYENIRYAFFDGKLWHITWYANGTYCSLGMENYSSYPLTSNTFQSKLLNLDTAVQAITEHFGTPQPIEDFFNQG